MEGTCQRLNVVKPVEVLQEKQTVFESSLVDVQSLNKHVHQSFHIFNKPTKTKEISSKKLF